MTWVRIDRESTEAAMRSTIEASRRAIVLLDSYRALGETTGLGDLGPATSAFVASSWRVLSDAWETYLRESIAVLEKLLELVKDQQAASVAGLVNVGGVSAEGGAPVGGLSEVIIGGTVVGGLGAGWAAAGPSISVIGGPAVIGGTVVGAATPMGAGYSIVGGDVVGEATPMGSGSAIVGGTPSYANDPLMRAAIAAQDRGDTRLASQMLSVSTTINDSINNSIALTLAPNGARPMGSYGPSAGYEAYGSYGIEVPIYPR